MKKYYLLATALAAMVSCTSDDYVGDNNLQEANGQAAISFNMNTPAVTRATQEDAAAAATLNYQFIVYAEKNESGKDEPAAGNLVFQNYKVAYTASTANTTTSNTDDWEYVGLSWTAAEQGNITTSTTDAQTIKYWDNDATTYTFTAVSASPADISGGKVKIKKLTSDATNEYGKGYEVDVTADAALSALYFSDRNNIAKGAGYTHNAVKMTFRNAQSQVRVGVYETIPGYDVKATKFYYVDNAAPTFATMTTASTTNFVANVPNTAGGVAGKFTVKYYDNTVASIENHPTITFAPTTASDKKNYITLGDQITAATKLAETSATPTFDKTAGEFTTVFPQEANDKNLKLKMDYQLSNSITGETINITGKTAEVPAQYLKWLPNYKYTYLFKITDSDLNPITFDAAVIEAEDGNVEYITTVTEPSITTYAKSSNVTADNEYKPGSNIYIVVNKGGSDVALTTTGTINAKLYTVSAQTGYVAGITEASVANALEHGTELPSGTWTVTDAGSKTLTVTAAAGLSTETSIDAEDAPNGNEITINCAKFTGTTTYTVVPTNAILAANKRYYKLVGSEYVEYKAIGTETATEDTYYTADLKYYVFEFTDTADDNKKYYKVIKVQ